MQNISFFLGTPRTYSHGMVLNQNSNKLYLVENAKCNIKTVRLEKLVPVTDFQRFACIGIYSTT